ncbi:MAG: chromate efflux transporter [Trueperaceae bacterium]
MSDVDSTVMSASEPRGSFFEVLAVFTKLGLTSFGGPVAHLGYFHDELIERRKWMDEESYADLVALCQFLPGPASSQVGIGLGISRAGIPGGFAAWLGFTLPSALALIAFAFGVTSIGDVSEAGWLQGLKIVAVAVVAHAVWGMATKLTPDRLRVTIAIAAAIVTLAWATNLGQVLVIVLGGLVGWGLLGDAPLIPKKEGDYRIRRRLGAVLLTLFFALLVGLPFIREATGSFGVAVADSFYRAGSLVFGGGHVVLPLLQAEVVPPGWIDNETFIAGYGAAQAVPGPLFTFSAYLGAVMQSGLAGVSTALIALVSIFVPSFLLLIGVLPFWERLRAMSPVQAALRGINAAVVGILLAALYDPVWTSAIFTASDLAIALAAFVLLAFWKWPAWLVVILSALTAAGVQAWL